MHPQCNNPWRESGQTAPTRQRARQGPRDSLRPLSSVPCRAQPVPGNPARSRTTLARLRSDSVNLLGRGAVTNSSQERQGQALEKRSPMRDSEEGTLGPGVDSRQQAKDAENRLLKDSRGTGLAELREHWAHPQGRGGHQGNLRRDQRVGDPRAPPVLTQSARGRDPRNPATANTVSQFVETERTCHALGSISQSQPRRRPGKTTTPSATASRSNGPSSTAQRVSSRLLTRARGRPQLRHAPRPARRPGRSPEGNF